MYEKIEPGFNVVFKEGRHIERCVVSDVKVEGVMRYFTLLSKGTGKKFTVSINDKEAGAYCPWHFIPADELSDY
jgi:hypothetical protein